MPTIDLQIIDTPTGVAVRHGFRPAVGHPLSPAQSCALDLIAHVHRTWGAGSVVLDTNPPAPPPAPAPQPASPAPAYHCWAFSDDTDGGAL